MVGDNGAIRVCNIVRIQYALQKARPIVIKEADKGGRQ